MNELQIACMCFGIVAVVSFVMWWRMKRIVFKQHMIIQDLSFKLSFVIKENKELKNEPSPEEKIFQAIFGSEADNTISFKDLEEKYKEAQKEIVAMESNLNIRGLKLECLSNFMEKLKAKN